MRSEELLRALRPICVLILAIWIIEVINLLMGHRLNIWFGLQPRSISGLVGVPLMPLLHGGVGHLAANTLPLGLLGVIGLIVAPKRFFQASVLIVLVSGLAVWALARNGTVVGASGLIFGWFGFLVTLGVIERSTRAIAGAAVVIIVYGGMIWGVLPQDNVRVSWEAHLFGAIAGAVIARVMQMKQPGD
ncbi:MAG: rhomboid family intramembrane serine protease [Pseudomonadota bacterium]